MILKDDAIKIFEAAVNAVKPSQLIAQHLIIKKSCLMAAGKSWPLDGMHKIYVLSVGKAAAAMALEAEKILAGNIESGLVVTKYQHALPLKYFDTIEAGHPVPDENGVSAANAIKKFLNDLTEQDLLLCFISGGASAFIADIADDISLDDLQQLSKLLLNCGASIHEINTVRKHICTLKGGQLLKHVNGAEVVSLIISDVMGDDMSVIASGLTVADNSTFKDAWKVIDKYALTGSIPASVKEHLQTGLINEKNATSGEEKPFKKVTNQIIASNAVALQAAAKQAKALGYHVEIINDLLEGEAKERAKEFVGSLINYNNKKPACLLMGGETTVTITGNGKGGRNQEFVLAALYELIKRNINVEAIPVILSCGTDGTDGPTDAAGAVVDAAILKKIKEANLVVLPYLTNNDAWHFFKQVNGLVITGPTQTNVMDIVVGLIE